MHWDEIAALAGIVAGGVTLGLVAIWRWKRRVL